MGRPFRKSALVKFTISILIGGIIWLSTSFGWLQSTVVPVFDQHLRDFYLSLAVDSRQDQAPGLLQLTFDNEALAAHGLPDRVPARAIIDALEVARASRQAIILDVDLATRSDLQELAPLSKYLTDWGKDPDAALLVLAHPQYHVSYQDRTAYRQIDRVVQDSPNIFWAGVGAFGDIDGVVRSYEYWSCREAPGAISVLPSAALYAWTRHETGSVTEVAAHINAAFAAPRDVCAGDAVPSIKFGTESFAIPREGLIEYQTRIDALDADAANSQYARDGLPRLMTIAYCSINPASCGKAGKAAQLSAMAADRIVLISVSNDFSRDEHMTPVGFMAGSLILGNAARALIISGPPEAASIAWQLLVLVSATTVIWSVWGAMEWLRGRIRRREDRPLLRKCLYGIANPAVVQWLAFALADVSILLYYHFFFSSSDWDGLVGASFGVTTVAAVMTFHEWAATSWSDHRHKEQT